MLQKPLAYAFNNFGRFYRAPDKKKSLFSRKLQNFSYELKQRLFYQNSFWSQILTILAKMAKETGILSYCLVKYITCLLDRGLHYHLWKIIRCSFKYFEQCMYLTFNSGKHPDKAEKYNRLSADFLLVTTSCRQTVCC